MALKMFLNSSFTQVFGHTTDNINHIKVLHTNVVSCPKDQVEEGQECVKNMVKDVASKEGRSVAIGENTNGFQMPLHYPRFKKSDYEKMEEWRLDWLLQEYGLSFKGTLDEKRVFAMGAFLWPDQL